MPSEELYNDGKWKIVKESAQLPDGRIKTTHRGYHADTAHIIAVPSEGHVLVLREYRPFHGSWVWMLPSGKVDKESDPLEAASRELREETGFRAENIRHYCSTYQSETYVGISHFYIAHDLIKDPLPQDDDEMIEVHDLPLEEAIERVLTTPFPRTVSGFGLLRYAREFGHR